MEKGNDDNKENGKTTSYGCNNANNSTYGTKMFANLNYQM